MKPQKIVMEAFGPYLNETVIDFTKLYSSGLFLITGATGCGKTTILDAMSYALYGRATGSLRDVRDMRTMGAPDSAQTRVTFEMEKSGRLYKFERGMRIREIKRRSGGVDRVTDYEENCSVMEDGEWRLLCSGAQMKDKAKELLGFSHEQFSQVVVLPQGEFRRLLTAPSIEKQKILETLFGTARWQFFSRSLSQKSKSISEELLQCTEKSKTLCKSAECETPQMLKDEISAASGRLKTLKSEIEELSKAYNERLQGLHKAESLDAKFKELEETLEILNKLKSRAQEICEKKQKLALAEKAEGALPYLDAANEAKNSLSLAEKQLGISEKLFILAQEEEKKAHDRSLSCDLKEEQQKKLYGEITRLENILEPAKTLCAAADELRSKGNEEKSAREKVDIETEKVKNIESELEKIKSRIQADNDLFIKRLPQLVEEKKELEADIELLKKFDDLKKSKEEIEKKLESKRTEFLKLRQSLKNEKGALESMQAVFDSDAAHRLSQGLHDGEKCPVCGSVSHPFPAAAVSGAPKKEELETQKGIVEELEEKLKKAGEDGARLHGEFDSCDRTFSDVSEKCKNIDFDLTGAQQKLSLHLKTLSSAQEAAKRRQELEARQKSAEEELLKARERQDKIKELADKTANVMSALKGRLSQLGDAVPVKLRNAVEVERKINMLKTAYENNALEIKNVRLQYENAKSNLSGAAERLIAAKKTVESTQSAFKKAEEEYNGRLETLGLPKNTDVKAISLDGNARDMLKREIESYDRETFLQKDRAQALNLQLKDKARPDIEKIRLEEQQAREENARAMSLKGALEAKLKNLEKISEKLAENSKNEERLRKDFALYDRLNRLTSGDNPLKTPIHQFVLGLMLEDIVACANIHLSELSRGRYTLLRASQPSRGNGTKGLDLSVGDAWSGGERGVNTLSGGEMFLASLSLAFGLSDVVQSYSGGIRLDSLFIDEGFGSLDTETLETAMDALEKLRLSGRLIGVISHVGELRERIAAHIDIIKMPDGTSDVKVVTP